MIESAVDYVAWLYVVTNSIRVLFYAPQICAVFRAEDGARAVSIATWGFWTFANLTALLYGCFVIHDDAFSAIFAGNLACTGAVTLIAIRKRLGSNQLQAELGRGVDRLGAVASAERA